MQIIVNHGRSICTMVTPARRTGVDTTGATTWTPPVTKTFGPGALIEVADSDAQVLIARGFARQHTPSVQ